MSTGFSGDKVAFNSERKDKALCPDRLQNELRIFRKSAAVSPREGNGQEHPNDKKTLVIMHLPVLRRSLLVRLRQVSWLGGCSCGLHGRFAFPSSTGQVALQSSTPRLQWRNRAGSSPDFPFAPTWAPEIVFVIPHHQTAYCQRYVSKSPLIRQNFSLPQNGTDGLAITITLLLAAIAPKSNLTCLRAVSFSAPSISEPFYLQECRPTFILGVKTSLRGFASKTLSPTQIISARSATQRQNTLRSLQQLLPY
jgi:hypothetical protein